MHGAQPTSVNMASSRHYLFRKRQLSLDPFFSQTVFRNSLYSSLSFVKKFKVERELGAHEGCVNCINFSFDGNILASGSDDLQIVLWDWTSGMIRTKFDSQHVANVFQVYECTLCNYNSSSNKIILIMNIITSSL